MPDRAALDDVYRILASQLGRDTIYALKENNPTPVSDLASMLEDTPANPGSTTELETVLYHKTLPLLADTGVIERTPSDQVRLTPKGRAVARADATLREEIEHSMYESDLA